ncbi:hypothetical protein JB92DRAFT_2847735 [Gautieria morchelliformis]|nr:hypothetical protein JB92DRAFT_2847735 [Gautieria morchelliformis]
MTTPDEVDTTSNRTDSSLLDLVDGDEFAVLDDPSDPAVPTNVPRSSWDSSSSPSNINPLTPEPQDSPVDPTMVALMSNQDEPASVEEFPNPYDDLLPVPLGHSRVYSAPELRHFTQHEPQLPMRLPSILRPSHPKSYNSADSRRASLALSSMEFGVIPLEQRPSMRYSPSYHLDDGQYSTTPWQPPRSSLSRTHSPSPPPPDDQRDEEPHIEVSERFEDRQSDTRSVDMLSVGHQPPRKSSDSWPATAQDLNRDAKKVPGWKFWSRRRSKKQKA